MFADRLDADEATAVAELLVLLAHADGVVEKEEASFIEGFAYSHGATVDVKVVPSSLEAVAAKFRTRESKVIAIQELVRIALSDGSYGDAERAGLRRIATALGLEDAIVSAVEQWVLDGIAWVDRGEKLLSG